MQRFIPLLIIAIAMSCMISCNEKPKNYKFVKRAMDGTEQVEEFQAKNDTDALNLYLDRMAAVVIENLNNQGPKFDKMFVISPDGDTLNTNQELLDHVSKNFQNPAPATTAGHTDTIILGTMPAR